MKFIYAHGEPTVFEDWASKVHSRTFGDSWQKRYFRIQGKCLFYFKKETDTEPCGYIPLINVTVQDIEATKRCKFGFEIEIIDPYDVIPCKRKKYGIQVENAKIRDKWKSTIMRNRARVIVGEPLNCGCEVTPTDPDVHTLLPYFVPELFEQLNTVGYKMRNIWSKDCPLDVVEHHLALLNQNYPLPLDDLYVAVNVLKAYMKRLPHPLLPYDAINRFRNRDMITPEQIRQQILISPATTRQFLRILGLHFKQVLDAASYNLVNQYDLIFIGEILVRQQPGGIIPPAEVSKIQERVAQAFLKDVTRIVDDVHQLCKAVKEPLIGRARVIQTKSNMGQDSLDVTRGLLVNIVTSDSLGWCTSYTANKKVGLVHESNLRPLTQEEENELSTGPSIDGMMDIVREKMPEMMLLFDAMMDEALKIREALDGMVKQEQDGHE